MKEINAADTVTSAADIKETAEQAADTVKTGTEQEESRVKMFVRKAIRSVASLFTDADWDADATKVFGFAVVTCGLVGFFLQKQDFQWVIVFGAGLISTGKFSKQG
jgi:hypothetical protein